MAEPPNIPTDLLHACLREQYSLAAARLEFLPRGYDYRAGVYRVVCDQDTYLLKVTSRPLHEPGCLVPRYLRDQGISAVVAPLPSVGGALWTRLGEWTVLLYPFLDGETSLTGMSDSQWRETGRVLRRIHRAQLPPEGFPTIRTEAFDPTKYLRWVRGVEGRHAQLSPDETEPAQTVRAAWVAHQPTIAAAVAALHRLGAALRSRTLPNVIAHADLHAANLLRDAAGGVFVLDWDEVMLAPRERDFLFIGDPPAHPFWQGYGSSACEAIDWEALTYFRWERVIQDLIEDAEQALFRDGVSVDEQMIAAQRFAATFAAGGTVDAAYAAAAHLPRDASAPAPRSRSWAPL